jgi:hypothetical protein
MVKLAAWGYSLKLIDLQPTALSTIYSIEQQKLKENAIARLQFTQGAPKPLAFDAECAQRWLCY